MSHLAMNEEYGAIDCPEEMAIVKAWSNEFNPSCPVNGSLACCFFKKMGWTSPKRMSEKDERKRLGLLKDEMDYAENNQSTDGLHATTGWYQSRGMVPKDSNVSLDDKGKEFDRETWRSFRHGVIVGLFALAAILAFVTFAMAAWRDAPLPGCLLAFAVGGLLKECK